MTCLRSAGDILSKSTVHISRSRMDYIPTPTSCERTSQVRDRGLGTDCLGSNPGDTYQTTQ